MARTDTPPEEARGQRRARRVRADDGLERGRSGPGGGLRRGTERPAVAPRAGDDDPRRGPEDEQRECGQDDEVRAAPPHGAILPHHQWSHVVIPRVRANVQAS